MADDSTLLVRLATPDDVATIVTIREQVAGEGRWIGRELPLPDDLGDRLRASITSDEGIYLVAEVDGVVVGDGGLHTNGAGHAELFMALRPGFRGQGIGGRLLDESITWARAQPDVHKVTLQVWPHNERAIALYRRAGFQVEGYRHLHWRRANGELWDVIEMGLLVDGG